MSMRGAVAGCVVLVCLVAQLAERTEGHITFFSPKEMMEMKVINSCLIGLSLVLGLSDNLVDIADVLADSQRKFTL